MTSMRARGVGAEAEARRPLLAEDEDGPADDHELSLTLDALREIAMEPYDYESSEHESILVALWDSAFPEVFALPSARWKELGFQGNDPRTDLRGAGIMGLRHFLEFMQHRQEGEVLGGNGSGAPSSGDASAFPWSLASINCTAMLHTHLHLNPKLSLSFAGAASRGECDDATLHRFLRLGTLSGGGGVDAAVSELTRCLACMHAVLLRHLHRNWRRQAATSPRLTIMDFPPALKATHRHLQLSLSPAHLRSVWHLSDVLDSLAKDHDAAFARSCGRSCGGTMLAGADGGAWETWDSCLLAPATQFLSSVYGLLLRVACCETLPGYGVGRGK